MMVDDDDNIPTKYNKAEVVFDKLPLFSNSFVNIFL